MAGAPCKPPMFCFIFFLMLYCPFLFSSLSDLPFAHFTRFLRFPVAGSVAVAANFRALWTPRRLQWLKKEDKSNLKLGFFPCFYSWDVTEIRLPSHGWYLHCKPRETEQTLLLKIVGPSVYYGLCSSIWRILISSKRDLSIIATPECCRYLKAFG